jgi:hypothetical protein
MKYFLSAVLSVWIGGIAVGQNQISTPSGQSLRASTDTLNLSGHFRINNGVLRLNNYPFLAVKGGNSFAGTNSGNQSITGTNNSFFGGNAGGASTTANANTFVGSFSGFTNTLGDSNTFVGYHSGYSNTSGKGNTFVGNLNGKWNTTGVQNTFIGMDVGYTNVSGSRNVGIGRGAGYTNASGNNNTWIGYGSGYKTTGDGNVTIGYFAGFNETGSNTLMVANSNTSTSLIRADFATNRLIFNGKVGVSSATFPTLVDTVNTTNYQLFVNGDILTKELVLKTNWADYVFKPDYKLRDLASVEKFIKRHRHLPGMLPGSQIEKEGLSVADNIVGQQEKIEELTLYLINQQKILKSQERDMDRLNKQFDEMEAAIERRLSKKTELK